MFKYISIYNIYISITYKHIHIFKCISILMYKYIIFKENRAFIYLVVISDFDYIEKKRNNLFLGIKY